MKFMNLRTVAACLLGTLGLCLTGTLAAHIPGDSTQWVQTFRRELRAEYFHFEQRDLALRAALWEVETMLRQFRTAPPSDRVPLLEEKIMLWEAVRNNELAYETASLRIRYRKGIDLIKMLYEKILSLDHHFTGMQIYQNVSTLSNPNSYPDFVRAQGTLKQRMKRKTPIQFPSILQSNSFLSATFSIVGTLLSDGTAAEKQEDLENVSCILDFTVRMHSDLSIIQHETEFLRTANKALREECEQLFADYTKVVGYFVPLAQCRQNDDWESLYVQLDRFTTQLDGTETGSHPSGNPGANPYGNPNHQNGGFNNTYGTNTTYGNSFNAPPNTNGFGANQQLGNPSSNFGNPANQTTYQSAAPGSATARDLDRRRIDLEFSTQRVAEFITRYNNFITQGTQYYQKFDNIITSYANEEMCSTQLPRQFSELKYDIKSTIEKFTNTYDLPEIQGSRLKNLLYGTFTH